MREFIVTHGSASAGPPIIQGLGRIYDRLRKRAYRASWLDFPECYQAIMGGDLQPQIGRFDVVDLTDAYRQGAKDALDAVAQEIA